MSRVTSTRSATTALAVGASAQDKAPKKKPAPATKQVAHKKPTAQQLRKFDELEKKRETQQPQKKK